MFVNMPLGTKPYKSDRINRSYYELCGLMEGQTDINI